MTKIRARLVRHGRAITFQLAAVAVSGGLFSRILKAIQQLYGPPFPPRGFQRQYLTEICSTGLPKAASISPESG